MRENSAVALKSVRAVLTLALLSAAFHAAVVSADEVLAPACIQDLTPAPSAEIIVLADFRSKSRPGPAPARLDQSLPVSVSWECKNAEGKTVLSFWLGVREGRLENLNGPVSGEIVLERLISTAGAGRLPLTGFIHTSNDEGHGQLRAGNGWLLNLNEPGQPSALRMGATVLMVDCGQATVDYSPFPR